MPYVEKAQRISMNQEIKDIPMGSPGNLNYAITELCLYYLKVHGVKYTTYNDIVGALECCKHEFIRREVNDYEDLKIQQNGDVY